MGRAILLLFAAVLLALLIMGVVKLVTERRPKVRKPSGKQGRMPTGATGLGDRGRRQLREAAVLISRAHDTPGIQTETETMLSHWLADNARPDVDEASLLNGASILLLRLETEDSMVPMLPDRLRADIKQWLDGYLDRKK
jgi:hypothetical protein